MVINFNNRLHFLIAFITFIGYYGGLIIFVSISPSDMSRLYSVPIRILAIILMLYFIVFRAQKTKTKIQPNVFLFFTFWFIYGLAIIREIYYPSPYLRMSLYEYAGYTFIYAIIPFIYFLRHSLESTLKVVKKGIIYSGLFLSMLSYFFYGKYMLLGLSRLSLAKYIDGGEVISPLSLSYTSSIIIAIALSHLLLEKPLRKQKKLYIFVFLSSLVPFFLGASRGSVFALLFSLLMIFVYKKDRNKKFKGILILVCISIFAYYLADYFQSGVFMRTSAILTDIENDNSSASRIHIWSSAYNQFMRSPIFGDSIQSDIAMYPHNVFLEVLMSVGIIGFIPFILLFIKAFKHSVAILRYRPHNMWVCILFLQGIVQNFFSGAIYTAIFFWGGMGLVFSIDVIEIKKNNSATQKIS